MAWLLGLPRRCAGKNPDILREHGPCDRDILDAVQVIAYLHYINRVADALVVEPEPEMCAAWERRSRPESD